MAGRSSPGASLITRALDVLGAFDEEHRRRSLTELAAHAGLTLPTTLRIARQLVDNGALTRDPDGRFAVGRRLWDIGLLAPVQTDLRDVASPFLQDLHAATRATVLLAVRDDDHVLYLDRLSGQTSVPVVSRVGSRLPMYATGVGKALLAHAPIEVQRRVLGALRPITPYTLTSARMLATQLARIRDDGFATTREEMTLGACSVAVPIRQRDDVVAALGLVVPDLRRDRSRLAAVLTVAAYGIGRTLLTTPR